ncbi:Mu transposase domain-containing protein [Salipaludibacillus sp. CF4.18]|uniref:Mu transposase domain-containing protein n=1 Tax=Salipaludibacillus sp. CF4.18 TaxID=3373081 RepID=UPI003EE57EC2
MEKTSFTLLPPYRFDTSKSITHKVDTFSTIKFDYNYYSVPVAYVDKDVSIKGFGNEIVIIHKQLKVAEYPRSYDVGKTIINSNIT